uniref:WH1 domain-containing protein n=1 Tax=Parascaris univalens TaxID=6257 RepID=A0A915AGD1_PARUN
FPFVDMSDVEEKIDALEQSSSASTNIPSEDEERDDQVLAESVDKYSAIDERRSSMNARLTSQRPQLYSENNCGAVGAQKQRTNHLTVECLVSVRAQVLTWDDALGGWLPVDDGALCGVSLLQQVTCQQSLSASAVQPAKRSSWSGVLSQNTLATPSTRIAPQWEYHIQGKRISDQTVLFNCTLMPHVTYRNAMPTFHHWRIKEQRFGLSFGSAFDASKFYNRLQKALDHLCRQSSGESNIDASEELEDDVFAPTELPDSFSSSSTTRPASFSNMNVDTQAAGERKSRNQHQSQSVPPISLPYSVPVIRTTMSSSPVGRRESAPFDDCPPMDPETARPCIAYSLPTSTNAVFYVNIGPSGQPIDSERASDGNETRQSTPQRNEEDRGEEDDLLITDDAISIPTTLHQSFAISLSSSSKTDKAESKASDRHSISRLRSKSRSEISSLGYRVPLVHEKMRSASNPCTDFFYAKSRYPLFDRYVSSPLAIDGAKSFIEAHASLYKNREHIILPKKKEPSSEMMRRECCFYCRNWYNVRDNPRGACKEAPDPLEIAIRRLTCYSVAQGVVYHCCRENDEIPANIGRYG